MAHHDMDVGKISSLGSDHFFLLLSAWQAPPAVIVAFKFAKVQLFILYRLEPQKTLRIQYQCRTQYLVLKGGIGFYWGNVGFKS